MVNTVHGHGKQESLSSAVAISKTLIASPPGPTVKDLLSSATPDLCGDRRMQAVVDRLSRDCTPPSRNSFGECAKDGDSAGMRSTIRAPDDRCVLDVLSLKRTQVLAVVFQFPFHHRLCAITASVERMGGRDADI